MRAGARGFTLLELLLVLVLIGIGTSVAIISTNSLTGRASEKQWSDRTQHVLRGLRNKAVLSARPVLAEINFQTGSISSGDKALLVLPIQFQYRSAGVTNSGAGSTTASSQIEFYPDGTMTSAQFLLISPGGTQEAFSLEAVSGRIRRSKIETAS